MVPFEVTIVTNVTTIADLGWSNSYQGPAVPFLATGFGAFLMRQAFLTFRTTCATPPLRRLRALAVHDEGGGAAAPPRGSGAVGVRASGPGTSTSGPSSSPKTTSSARCRSSKQLQGLSIDQINVTFAGAVIAVLPLVILLLAFQKQLVRADRRCGEGLSHDGAKERSAGVPLATMPALPGSRSRPASAGAQTSKCPPSALKKASKPVEITFWHSRPENETTLQALTEQFNTSQSDVKVNLVNQVSYDDTFTKYKAGLSSGTSTWCSCRRPSSSRWSTRRASCRRVCAPRPTSTASPTSCPES